MNATKLFGKCIRTFKGNLLCCIDVQGREFFFAMTPQGNRFFFVHELKRGNYLTAQEWENALKTWEGSKIETLAGEELSNAQILAYQIASDFAFEMSPAQKGALPSHHALYFK
jgi:hypothetical protein